MLILDKQKTFFFINSTICGTPYFIAPEVLNKQGHSFKSDIWALGCIFYVLLTCQYPFYADTIKVYKTVVCISKYVLEFFMNL